MVLFIIVRLLIIIKLVPKGEVDGKNNKYKKYCSKNTHVCTSENG